MTIVRVTFKNRLPNSTYTHIKEYDFFTDLDLHSGDLVVVDTQYGYATAEVSVVGVNSKVATKWVVCKVDLEGHNQRMEQQKKLASVKAKMESRRKKLEQIEVYYLLAEKDEEMAELLDEYNALNSKGVVYNGKQ